MNTYSQKIEEAKSALQQKLHALDEINIAKLEQEKAQYQQKIQQIDEQIRQALKAAGIELGEDSSEASANGRLRAKKLPKLVPGSEEWNKVAGQLQIVMKNYPEGLNGRQIAYKMGLTKPNAVMRIQPVIKATLQKSGQKASTKYFLPK